MKVKRTSHQKAIVRIVLQGADKGTFYSIKELHALLPYTCDYGSLRTSLRFLLRAGIVEKKPAGNYRLIIPTNLAYAYFRAGA